MTSTPYRSAVRRFLTLAAYMPARGGMRCLWPGNHQGPRIVDSAQLGRPSVDSWDPRIPGWARLQRLTIGPRSGRTENAEDDGVPWVFSWCNWLPDHQAQTSYSRWGTRPTNRVHAGQGQDIRRRKQTVGQVWPPVYSGVAFMQPRAAMRADASSDRNGRKGDCRVQGRHGVD